MKIFKKASTIFSVSFSVSLLPKSGKVWIPLFKDKKLHSLSVHSAEKLLVYVTSPDKENQPLVKAKKEILVYKRQKSKLEDTLRSKTQEFNKIKQELDSEIKSNAKLKQELKSKRSRIDSLFLDVARTYKLEKQFVQIHPGLYKFKGKIISLSLAGQKLLCHVDNEIIQVHSFFERFCKRNAHVRSKTAEGNRKCEDLNKLIHTAVISVLSLIHI